MARALKNLVNAGKNLGRFVRDIGLFVYAHPTLTRITDKERGQEYRKKFEFYKPMNIQTSLIIGLVGGSIANTAFMGYASLEGLIDDSTLFATLLIPTVTNLASASYESWRSGRLERKLLPPKADTISETRIREEEKRRKEREKQITLEGIGNQVYGSNELREGDDLIRRIIESDEKLINMYLDHQDNNPER